mgnify:CR=1 FL=1
MKRLFSILSLLLIVLSMSAQTKILERSAKKTPAWLNTAVAFNVVDTRLKLCVLRSLLGIKLFEHG